jgi:hypothetical protein
MPSVLQRPGAFLGEEIGSDFFVAGYDRLAGYWTHLAAHSPRVRLERIGTTSEGRDHLVLVASSPDNLARLDAHLDAARAIAYPDPARRPAEALHGVKPVVCLSGGVHTSEVIPAEALFELAHRLADPDNAATGELLEEMIVVVVHGNPDGHEYAARNYMRELVPGRRAAEMREVLAGMVPGYSGADNNRDGLLCALPETRNLHRALYHRFCPQIIYDAHQTGPLGVAMYLPPYKEPLGLGLDPMIATLVNELGLSLHGRFLLDDKPGTYHGDMAEYQLWQFGLVSSPLHNVVAFHSEVIGTPHPQRVPLIPDRQLPRMALPRPLEPGIWHASQSLDYQLTAFLSTLEWAGENRRRLLATVRKANVEAILSGRRDSWTVHDGRIRALRKAATASTRPAYDAFDLAAGVATGNLRGGEDVDGALHASVLRAPSARDPRAYIIPAAQPAGQAAVDFCNALMLNGIAVRQTTEAARVDGLDCPAGSWLVTTDQSKRGFLLHAFEPHPYPQDLARAEGADAALYGAGGTLAMLMGFCFGRILDGALPASRPLDGDAAVPAGVASGAGGAGVVIERSNGNVFRVVNAALRAGHEVAWLTEAGRCGGKDHAQGSFWIEACPPHLVETALSLGLDVHAAEAAPAEDALPVRPARVAVYDVFGGLANAGWVRFFLDGQGFSHRPIHVPELDAGQWQDDVDVLIIPDGRAATGYHEPPPGTRFIQPPLDRVPPEFHHLVGSVSAATVEQIRRFVAGGGRLVTIGAGEDLLPELLAGLGDHAAARSRALGLSPDEAMVRKSVFAATLDTGHPLAHGCAAEAAVASSGRCYEIPDGVTPIARFRASPLLSGLAVHDEVLAGGCIAFHAPQGDGDIVAFAFDVVHRGQSAGTFPLLANAILSARAR